MGFTSDHPSIPSATYRLQFHKGFNFAAARALVPYLAKLGISHVYASPIFRAAPGSLHGYDICDHNQINPELGSREDFDAFATALRDHQMGLILDFVPNHMGINQASNGWWMDVLENGPSSPYARFFDINWVPVKRELENKVLLPILGDQYGRVLESGDLRLKFRDGAFYLHYFERVLPTAPRTTRTVLQGVAERLQEEGRAVPVELDSILFLLEHLPERTEVDLNRIADRAREKEIVKIRLARLCAEQPQVSEAINAVIEQLQTGGPERDFDPLDALISAQPYRLAFWRVAAEEINYRRFFDINDLAALRMELPEVFDATHQLLFELLASGLVTGLRIDHVDGLWDPLGYLTKLQSCHAELVHASGSAKPLFLLVEKILGPSETLHRDWPVHGTTGYEFAAQVTQVLVDASAESAFTESFRKLADIHLPYREVVYRSKLLTMRASMAGEVNMLAHMLNRISESNRWYRDFTLNALTTAIREIIACFPVYRTYAAPDGTIGPEDARVVLRAIVTARRRNQALDRTVFEFIRDVLIPRQDNLHPVNEEARREFALKLQQCTGPITAKGVEDTAFYIYNRLNALNEVGCDPGFFGATIEEFHDQNRARAAKSPHSLLATSTHDTKRSEDVRARIAALSEMPQEWARAVRGWRRSNRRHRRDIDGEFAPDANEEYLLYQTLLGSWPLLPMTADQHTDYVRRIREYMMKALREAKTNSSWIDPNEAWDNAVGEFVERVLSRDATNRFFRGFEPLARRIAELGAMNSLAQVVLKLTCPGVPDIYQGQEIWDFSLVDPDNRRPVDYDLRRTQLEAVTDQPDCAALLREWKDGRIKFFITHRLLQFRRDHPQLFQLGNYQPVPAQGNFADHCIAFRREHEGQSVLVLVPRLTSRIGAPPIGERWRQTSFDFRGATRWRDLFTGTEITGDENVPAASALRTLPVAVFVSA